MSIQQLILSYGAAGNITPSDPPWANVSSLLHFNGTNGSTTITDEKGKTWTAAGNAQISTSNVQFGSGCLLLDGSGDYVSTGSSSDFDFGSGDFTVEGWFRPEAYPAGGSVAILAAINSNSTTYAQVRMAISNTGALTVLLGTGVATWHNTSASATGGTLPLNTYTHVRAKRKSGVLSAEINGVQVLSYAAAVTLYAYADNSYIGTIRNSGTPSFFFTGRVDDARISKGFAVMGGYPTSEYPNS
ncbi:LamG domain-containing protein [Pseudomonas sp. YH-1]|uniref:LamG domain-containing protein n=1 Tax=Pseudomonas sp. YH-1 TaxID=3384787 RepID=UPI003F810502